MFGSIGILLIGNVGGAFLTVLRTIVISRLISLEDFGIGTVLVLVLAMVEMISALGFQQQIVQASDGNGQSFQQKLQGVSILRGLLAGSAIYLLAHPISSFFDMPQTVGAIQFIAIIPVILGFIHLDIHRLARQMKHFPSAIVALLPPLGSFCSSGAGGTYSDGVTLGSHSRLPVQDRAQSHSTEPTFWLAGYGEWHIAVFGFQCRTGDNRT